MRLYPPDPEVKLYETFFGEDDPFNRIATSKALSDLVERIEDPLVIALDGQWGSGKTYFLKRWVGSHTFENKGTATTVYFDAFAHDFLDDPLVAMTGAIGERIAPTDNKLAWKKVRGAVAKLAKPLGRVGLAVATSGISEVAAPMVDAALKAGSEELERAADDFWRKEDGKRAAMQQLRESLISLTHPTEGEGAQAKPLVVVIDELDRCRPDYALSLLETIKHFFSIPNIHFVLGVNLDALEHSVRARYGASFDAERYLRRFISLPMTLPTLEEGHRPKPLALVYLQKTGRKMGLPNKSLELLDQQMALVATANSFTMRDMNGLLSGLALMSVSDFENKLFGWQFITISMLIFKHLRPDLTRKVLDGSYRLDDILEFYGIEPEMTNQDEREKYKHEAMLVSLLWEFILSNGARPEDDGQIAKLFDRWGDREGTSWIPRKVHDEVLNRFSFPTSPP
ncbi:KAP family P-loop NTPase fold protein [Pararhodobacter sp.]|uniref:KAP family P-loop NTPase fold protein n=1 Tax=Pararhodobacter sp. TaxID=2127056 RepID=UPI002AFE5448|nr:P-loop NTPase fold protein [Pararhodobacter sp.]